MVPILWFVWSLRFGQILVAPWGLDKGFPIYGPAQWPCLILAVSVLRTGYTIGFQIRVRTKGPWLGL